MTNKTVLIGMSGGVDSSVAAALLKQQGYKVTGVTIQTHNDCTSIIKDAKQVAKSLNIEHIVINLQKEFQNKVINDFILEYLNGKTPNPCVQCNKHIKFAQLLDKATELGINYIATGHYAKIEKQDNKYILKKSSSQTKDQTYFLYNLTQEQLAKTLFPLENIDKKQVREIAQKLNLPSKNKPESQEICFIPNNNYNKFIAEHTNINITKGNILNQKGEAIGEHNGTCYYTIGQRKGINTKSNKPLYVTNININNNTITVGEESDLYKTELTATDINLISSDTLPENTKVTAKIRYKAKESQATITQLKNKDIRVKFTEPQRAITPGQSIVFYQEDTVIGGGIII